VCGRGGRKSKNLFLRVSWLQQNENDAPPAAAEKKPAPNAGHSQQRWQGVESVNQEAKEEHRGQQQQQQHPAEDKGQDDQKGSRWLLLCSRKTYSSNIVI